MNKPVILTGLRANNDLHIGNYFGALLPIVDMAKNKSDDYRVNLMLADLHSFTTPIDHHRLQKQITENLRAYVAAGLPLDNDNIHLFRQSYVPAHSELTVVLDSFTGMGEMSRMTQFKDKSAQLSEDRVSVGLFNYPVLMAVDILLYGSKYVPVGDDQTQHLEFTRDIAERMNKRFGELFVVPEPVKKQHEFFGKDQGLRIKDLADPSKKMSKSEESDKGVIFLNDDPEAARKKIMSATTDDLSQVKYDPDNQPGVSNLLQIYALLSEKDVKEAEKEFVNTAKYSDFKQVVADKVVEFLSDFQDKLFRVDQKAINSKLVSSESAMNKTATETLSKVQKAVGLR
ncbi:MAG TPA: tryptophan--tRNA ligase [Candidatus Saccharimonadales bacterium]|nr:tryptophan--tRNA ligase [Candidatus Saccharimonadales bacterium]